MSAALRMKVGVYAAGLSYLLVGYAQAQQQVQQQVQEQITPAQYGDEDTGRPFADRRLRGRADRQERRTTTYFRGPDAAGSTTAGTVQGVDHYLANCLLIKNQAEIDANEFGQQHAQSDEVKQFASQMIEDHRQLSQKLERVAQGTTSENSRRSSEARNSTTGGASNELNQLLAIDRQITDRCSQLSREMLEKKSGAEFDQCFVGSQIGGHVHMLAALDVIAQQAGGDLRQIAQEAKPKVEEHLKHAEQLAKQLQSESGSQDRRQARAER